MNLNYFNIQTKISSNEKYLLKGIDKSFDKVNLFDLLKKKIKIKNENITIQKKKFKISKNNKFYIVAFGKMGDAMINSACKIFKSVENVRYFLISNKINKNSSKNFISYKSQHPIPGKLSIIATKRLINFLKIIEKNSILIFLISGGGSSLLTYPIKGITLKKKIKLTKKLFSLNTEPKYLNYFRIALSRVKNGGLLKYVKTNNIFNFMVSDENEDKIELLSSGPTVNKSLKLKNRILSFFKKNKEAIKLIGKKKYLNIYNNLNSRNFNKKTNNSIILNNYDFIKILKKEIKKYQKVNIYTPKIFLFGDYEKNIKKIIKILEFVDSKKKKCICIFGCQIETPMEAKSEQKLGGRLQHLTADLLSRNDFKNVKIVSIATDGQDYDPDVFGTIVKFSKKIDKKIIDQYIKNKITKKFHMQNKSLIISKKNTNLNLKDILIVYNY